MKRGENDHELGDPMKPSTMNETVNLSLFNTNLLIKSLSQK